MAARSIVARPAEGGGFAGRYVHFDGEPTTRVWVLRHLVLNVHAGDVAAAARALLDEHPNGWVRLPDEAEDDGECFCHSGSDNDRIDMGLLTHEGTADRDLHYAYVLHPDRIEVLARNADRTGWTYMRRATWSD
ncbi:hypothetical protein ACWD6R_16355 [Streptomyces sp. NPDC005151]